MVRSLAGVGGFLCVLGVVVNLFAAVWAFMSKGTEGFGFVFLGGAVGALLSMLTFEAAKSVVLVVVDLARNLRAIRRELTSRTPNG